MDTHAHNQTHTHTLPRYKAISEKDRPKTVGSGREALMYIEQDPMTLAHFDFERR